MGVLCRVYYLARAGFGGGGGMGTSRVGSINEGQLAMMTMTVVMMRGEVQPAGRYRCFLNRFGRLLDAESNR